MPGKGSTSYKPYVQRKPFGSEDQDRYDRNERRQTVAIKPVAQKPTSPNIGPTASVDGSRTGAGSNDLAVSGQRTKTAQGDVWDGWAKRYVPGERDLLFGNPDIIVRDWLSQGAYRNNPQMAGDMSRYANIMFGDENTGGLYELLTAGSLNPKVTGDDDQINALVALLGEQSKVGGRSPSVEKMLQLLFEGFNDPNSTMGGMLNAAGGDDVTTGQAINAIMQFIPLLGEFTGNRRYSDAMYRQAQGLAQQYMDAQVKGGNKGSFLDLLEKEYLR